MPPIGGGPITDNTKVFKTKIEVRYFRQKYMDPLFLGFISFIGLFLLLAIGMPIVFSLAFVGCVGLLLTGGLKIMLATLGSIPLATVMTQLLTVIPMFLWMGSLAAESGVTMDAFDVGFKWFGRMPGGLAVATTFTSACFAAVCGSSIATVVTIGRIALPEMDRYNYDRRLSLGCIACSGSLGILIPPSIIAVLYAVIVQVSVGKQLIAGILPGILTAIFLTMLIVIRATITPALGPRAHGVSWKESFASLKGIISIFILFIIVIGSIYGGICTPTEAAAMGTFGALIITIIRRRLKWVMLWHSMLDACSVTAMIMAISIGAMIYTSFLTRVGFGISITNLVLDLGLSPTGVIIVFILIFVLFGMFLDPYGMLLISLPIMYPIIQQLGYDGIWFGVIVIKMVEIAMITPPVGLNVYVLKGLVPDVSSELIFASIFWFFITELAVVAMLIAFPKICLFLPDLMRY